MRWQTSSRWAWPPRCCPWRLQVQSSMSAGTGGDSRDWSVQLHTPHQTHWRLSTEIISQVSVQTQRRLTHSHRAADGVVQAARVVHVAAVGGVVEHRGGEEAEVVRSSRNVHGSSKDYGFTCRVQANEDVGFEQKQSYKSCHTFPIQRVKNTLSFLHFRLRKVVLKKPT